MFAPTDLLLKHANADLQIMLLGNKCDHDGRRVVSTERGQMVSRLHILYYTLPAFHGHAGNISVNYEWHCVVRRSRESLSDCFVQHSYSF